MHMFDYLSRTVSVTVMFGNNNILNSWEKGMI
jgi:hypothetical protein